VLVHINCMVSEFQSVLFQTFSKLTVLFHAYHISHIVIAFHSFISQHAYCSIVDCFVLFTFYLLNHQTLNVI